MPIEWHRLRPWDGSQQSAFEELCCQLAGHESVPNGSHFTRKGPPDGGVECYWKLPDGSEWGWQAKFFLSTPGDGQWSQIANSVRTALEKHPNLARYIVCFPLDRQDPRIDNQMWFMDRWNHHVEQWKQMAVSKGMSIDFDYWGNHEIFDRLSRDEYRGRVYFWFNQDSLSQQWFAERVATSVANLGPKYTPDINVELPISRVFDGLCHTERFYQRIGTQRGKIRRLSSGIGNINSGESQSVLTALGDILTIYNGITPKSGNVIDVDRLTSLIDDVIGRLSALSAQDQPQLSKEQRDSYTSDIRELQRTLNDAKSFIWSNEVKLYNVPQLLITGSAGTGKSHLLAHEVRRRIDSGCPALLFIGTHFQDSEPWSQMIAELGLSCQTEEFLGALQSLGESLGSRVLLCIDALNEGPARRMWMSRLPGMLVILARYSMIGLAVSVRDTYEDYVIPDGINTLTRQRHMGFSDHEFKAMRTYFDFYGIQRPQIPLLVPEFQNPLFLNLFCKGLHNRGLTELPSGLQGMTAVFTFFIESVNEKLSQLEYLDYNPRTNVVQEALDSIAREMSVSGNRYLSIGIAERITNLLVPRQGFDNSLYNRMISEGLLVQDMIYSSGNAPTEVVMFTYERLADHLISQHLLKKLRTYEELRDAFIHDVQLVSIVENEASAWRNKGLIEAMLIQIPENLGVEFFDVAPNSAGFIAVCEAFVGSLIWRHPISINNSTHRYIGECVKSDDLFCEFMRVVLHVNANPTHPLNAEYLHERLKRCSLVERDQWWSTFLFQEYGQQGVVDQIIDWAWNSDGKAFLSEDSAYLMAKALSWFLTTSHRPLRDKATKALVSLLSEKISIISKVLSSFMDVNDPYVLERLIAVAYGCAMRNPRHPELQALAKYLYTAFFENRTPPIHILIRDYARGIIELVLANNHELDINLDRIRPIYGSVFPDYIPNEDELESYGATEADMPDREWARFNVYESVMGFGDFARYILGTNSNHFDWSSRRLGDSTEVEADPYTAFVDSLTVRQKIAWDQYLDVREKYRRLKFLVQMKKIWEEPIGGLDSVTDEQLEQYLNQAELNFRRRIGKKKQRDFREVVQPYLDQPEEQEHHKFDIRLAQRYILSRIFEIGWSVERFGVFERYGIRSEHYLRSANKPERISKKYQWIAYHEFLALVADNFEFNGEYWGDEVHKYNGPWQVSYLRDIDPSVLITGGTSETEFARTNAWWVPVQYSDWELEQSDLSWLQNVDDLPDVKNLIEITDDNGQEWLVLETLVKWEQPSPPDEERYERPRRELWLMIKSYIVDARSIREIYDWGTMQNFEGRWMPESSETHNVFLGEYYWSPAYADHIDRQELWSKVIPRREQDVQFEVLITAQQYVWESGNYDCSVNDSIRILMPVEKIVRGMNMHYSGREGELLDDQGQVIAVDPSVKQRGPNSLLVRKDAFTKFLRDNGYEIMWTTLGEKNIIGSGMHDGTGRLEINGVCKLEQGNVGASISAHYNDFKEGERRTNP